MRIERLNELKERCGQAKNTRGIPLRRWMFWNDMETLIDAEIRRVEPQESAKARYRESRQREKDFEQIFATCEHDEHGW